jgi:acetamidase/formamidase
MSDGNIHQLTPSVYYYTFGPYEPAVVARSGDTVVAETRDAEGHDKNMDMLTEAQKQRSDITSFREANPLVGPVYLEEAEPGDTLAVKIQQIKLNRDSAWSKHRAHFGGMTGEVPGKRLFLNEPLPEKRFHWQLDRSRNTGTWELTKSRIKRIEIPLHPFLGCIGVAPRFGRVEMSITPGEYGGNMDCIETREGTTVLFPVWVRGAYLFFGDVHAAQGDGEICGVALETTAEVTLKLEVIKDNRIEWPRLEDETHIMATGSGRPLMDCVRIAQVELINWLVDGYGFDKWEAFQAVSQVGTMRIGNVVDPNYTVVAKFPKRYLVA